MNRLSRIGHSLKVGALTLLRRPGYRPTYRESSYHRPVFQRLTTLARFLLMTVIVVMLVAMGVMANQSYAARGSTQLLSDQLTARPLPTHPVTPIVVIAEDYGPTATPNADANSAGAPAPTATPDLTRAPWAGVLFKQPDGTLTAPQKVIAQALLDLGAWYNIQRDLSLDDWLARRDTILTTYFTGSALQEMQTLEQNRDLYAMNRAGRFSIDISHFSADGLTAKAAIITRDWVSDVYDVQSRQLVARGKIKKDTLTIYSIAFDMTSGHWKFAHVDEVSEITP